MSSHELPPLPRGWVWSRVGEVGEVRLGRQRSPKDHAGKYMRPYLRVANVFEARIDTSDVLQMNFTPEEFEVYQLKPGDILLNEGQSLEWVGRPAIYRGEAPGACFQNTLVRFRAYPCVLPEFALLVFRVYLHSQRFQRIAKWTTNIAHLGAQRFAELEFPVPPLAEQRRIVAESEKLLSDLDVGIAALRRVQRNLKRYRASVLKAACEGRLVPTEAELARTEGRNFEPADKLLEHLLQDRQEKWKTQHSMKTNTAGLLQLAEGWTWVTVDALLAEPLCNGISVKGSDHPPGVPALKLGAMGAHDFDYTCIRYLPLEWSEVADLEIQAGDFFVSRGNGSLSLVGRGTRARLPPQGMIFPDTMIRFRMHEALARTGWIPAIWSSKHVRSQIEARAKTTAGIWKISQADLVSIVLPLPPLKEQARIVTELSLRLSQADRLEALLISNLRRADRLRLSVLKRAFDGTLVPQDPNDEPASALLERVRQQRASPPPVPLPPGQMALDFDRPKRSRLSRRRSASS